MIRIVFVILIIFTSLSKANDVVFPFELTEVKGSSSDKAMTKVLSQAIDIKAAKEKEDISGRLEKVSEAALAWGLKEGQYYANNKYKMDLEKYATKLSAIANFSQFVVDGQLLLPKFTVSERLFERISNTKIRKTGFSYSLFEPAKIVSVVPTWRDYLNFTVEKPTRPSALFIPRNEQEKTLFSYEFKRGWEIGERQAELVFNESYKRLKRDLNLHYNFMELAISNVLRMPSMHSTDPTVIISSDGKTLYGDDVIYTVDQATTFESLDKWKPVFRVDQDG